MTTSVRLVGTCLVCGGDFDLREMAYEEHDNTSDLGPVCYACLEALVTAAKAARLVLDRRPRSIGGVDFEKLVKEATR
jgi:hypothetical protein